MKGKRIKPAGWLALAVAAIIVVSVVVLAGQSLWVRVRGLETLPPYHPRFIGTPGETMKNPGQVYEAGSAGSGSVSGPTFSRQVDLAGRAYLAPPPAVEAQIRAAFNAVLGCALIQDVSDEEAAAYDRDAALESAAQLAAPELMDYYRRMTRIMLANLGPENAVYCQSESLCSVGQAKLGSNGGILYDEEMCAVIGGLDSPCVIRPERFDVTDQNPYQLYVATVRLQADGVWRVVEMDVETLPKPPG